MTLSKPPSVHLRGLPPFFQKRLAHKQMFKQSVKHYRQWLRSSIHLKTKFSQSPTDSIRLQGPSKRTSSDLLYPVASVIERNREGGKCKISRVLQSPVSCTQASPKVEASNRPKQAQHLPTCRKVQNRPIRRLPSHPHPPKLKEVSKVLPQVASVSVHFPSLRTSHGPSGLYNDCKRGEADGPVKGNQTSPVPGRLADQGPVSGRSTSKHSDSGGPNSVLRVDNKSGEVRTKTYSSVFVRGLRIPSRFSPCKTHSREMAQTSGFDPTTQVKTCFDCKMFDVANWVACLNREDCPGGTPSHETLSVSPQGALEISSVVGQPPSLDRNHSGTPRMVAESQKRDERCRPSSQRPQYPTLYRRLKRRLGHSLRANLYIRSVVRQGNRLHINVLELKAVSLALQRFKDQCQNQTVLVATDNSTVVAYINKQGGTHSAEMCALLWKIMTWYHHYQITLKARHILGCLNVIANLLSRSNQVQSTEWSLHLQGFNRSVSSGSPEPQSSTICVSSPRPKCLGHRCSEHELVGSHCLCLPFHSSPSQGDPKNQAIQLPDYCNSPRLTRDALVLGPSAALNRDPISTSSAKNSSQTVPQLCVPQQSTASQPPRLVSRSGQLQEQGFSVEVAERIAAPQRSSTGTIYKSKWALFEKWCRENSVDFSTPSVKQVSDFFMYLYQDLNRFPSTIDGYRTAIVDTLGPSGSISLKLQTLTGNSPVFTGIFPKVLGIFLSGTFLLFSMSSQNTF